MNAPSQTTPSDHRVPDWQRAGIRKLMWIGPGAAIAGMLGEALFGRVTHHPIQAGLLVIPWVVVLIMIIPAAYRRGVRDAKTHREQGP